MNSKSAINPVNKGLKWSPVSRKGWFDCLGLQLSSHLWKQCLPCITFCDLHIWSLRKSRLNIARRFCWLKLVAQLRSFSLTAPRIAEEGTLSVPACQELHPIIRLTLLAYALPLTFICTLLMYQIGCMPSLEGKKQQRNWTKINILPLLFSVKCFQKQQQAEQHHIFPVQGYHIEQHQSH